MAGPIEILHPVPRILASRGGALVDAYVPERTVATPVEVEAGAFRPLRPGIDHPRTGEAMAETDSPFSPRATEESLFLHGGRTWRMLRVGGPGSHGVKAGDFLDWLTGTGQAAIPLHALAGTPLTASRLASRPMTGTWVPRGAREWARSVDRGAQPPRGAREVRFDGGETARDALLRFVADDLRLSGDRVYLRCVPVVRYVPWAGPGNPPARAALTIELESDPDGCASRDRADRLPALVARTRHNGGPNPPPDARRRLTAGEMAEAVAAVPATAIDDSDLGRLAHMAPRAAVGLARAMVKAGRAGPGEAGALATAADALLPLAALGAAAAIPAASWEAAVSGARALLLAVEEAAPRDSTRATLAFTDAARDLGRHLARNVLPRFDALAPAEDADAFAALSPA